MPKVSYRKSHIPPFARIAEAVTKAATVVSEEAVEMFAEIERDLFVNKIKAQTFASFNAKPLSPRYLQFKARHDLDMRTMIATGWYIGNIKVQHRKKGRRRTVFVGFDRATRARNKDGETLPITLNKVAYVQEKGSVKAQVPARPHWGPHLETMRIKAKPLRVSMRKKIMARAKRGVRF